MNTTHPYTKFEKSKLWRLIDAAIADLEKNGDLQLTTHRKHVIGYMCEHLNKQTRVPLKISNLKKKKD